MLSSNARFRGGVIPLPNTVFTVSQADWVQHGQYDFEMFGFALAVARQGVGMQSPMLLVGAPGYLQSTYVFGQLFVLTFYRKSKRFSNVFAN